MSAAALLPALACQGATEGEARRKAAVTGRVVQGGYTRPCEHRADDPLRDPQAAGGPKTRCGWPRSDGPPGRKRSWSRAYRSSDR
jgi:hypothetical protein